MNGVYKKEMRSYRTTMTGYVFVAFVLAVIGIYFAYINLNLASPDISGVFQSIQFIFLIIVPILTMRVIAEERKQKTDQLLYTLPLTVSEIVVGKYLALITMYAIPMGIVCIYPLILRQCGTVNMKTSYLAILGFFLLGCANLAIGLFMSSLTDNPVIAAVTSFGLLLICYLMDSAG
ncbi:MAG: ABC transporter permease, partial [Eubacteriales bacterium]|nr:ABC transporter permease [Eubacteriales bacterium]